MATLTPTLTLASTDLTSDTGFSFTVTDSLTIDTAGPFRGLSTNFVILQTTASVQYARLSPGEFCFFPVNDSNGLEARADTASCILEFAFFKKG